LPWLFFKDKALSQKLLNQFGKGLARVNQTKTALINSNKIQ
jgi:hypothetical protein